MRLLDVQIEFREAFCSRPIALAGPESETPKDQPRCSDPVSVGCAHFRVYDVKLRAGGAIECLRFRENIKCITETFP